MNERDYQAIVRHYAANNEDRRFEKRWCWIEYQTTLRYIHKYLRPGSKILEIGAGTGRYSLALAREGYHVTAVELVEHNLDILRSKITPDMTIQAMQGNALDLGMLADESYDMTLVFGPMYHLFAETDKRRALSEALRVTKTGGIVMVAYCITDGPMINFIFRLQLFHAMVENHTLDQSAFQFHPEHGFLFEHVTKEDIDRLMEGFGAQRLHYVATDGLPSFLQQELEAMDQETFQAVLRYHLSVCERPDLVGATAHSLDILRKQ